MKIMVTGGFWSGWMFGGFEVVSFGCVCISVIFRLEGVVRTVFFGVFWVFVDSVVDFVSFSVISFVLWMSSFISEEFSGWILFMAVSFTAWIIGGGGRWGRERERERGCELVFGREGGRVRSRVFLRGIEEIKLRI